jgi:hypothetical protein
VTLRVFQNRQTTLKCPAWGLGRRLGGTGERITHARYLFEREQEERVFSECDVQGVPLKEERRKFIRSEKETTCVG